MGLYLMTTEFFPTRRTAGATRSSGRTGAATVRDYDPKTVRVWAESQGIEVSQRGRVPAELVAKFQAANA